MLLRVTPRPCRPRRWTRIASLAGSRASTALLAQHVHVYRLSVLSSDERLRSCRTPMGPPAAERVGTEWRI